MGQLIGTMLGAKLCCVVSDCASCVGLRWVAVGRLGGGSQRFIGVFRVVELGLYNVCDLGFRRDWLGGGGKEGRVGLS